MVGGGSLLVLSAALALVHTATVQNTPRVMHPAFKDAGRSNGLQIWRIESFEPKPVPPNEYGKFYSGDSYIVLSTVEDKKTKGTFTWDIHYWLGEKTSQDESGAAAILAVELDDQLGGGPVQHREVQDHESQKFLSYFKSGIRYMPGGVASGFNHVTVNDPGEKKLYQVKGKRNVRVRQVQIDVKSMNKGDCFILDAGNDVYVYVGSNARGSERVKAVQAANQVRDQDHAGRAKVHIIDSSATQTEVAEFFSKLGSGGPNQVPEGTGGEADEDFEKNIDNTVGLYKVSDASGKLVADKVSEKPLKQAMLSTDDCFVLDTVKSGIFVWVGKKATTQEKVEALKRGEAFLKQNNYPAWTKMKRVVEGAEPTAFKEYFAEWKNNAPGGRGPSRRARSVGSIKCGRVANFMPDDGTGQLEVFRVENRELVPVDPSSHGVFFQGDSYVIKYQYSAPYTGTKNIIYFWQGKDSTADEKIAAALHAVKLDQELGGAALQIRVAQGEETAHFIKIFKGKLVILSGGKGSGFRNIRDYDTYDTDGTRLFQLVGTCEDDVRAIQVPEEVSSLDTNDAFFLETPSTSYVWIGNGCSRQEEEMGEFVRRRLCPDRPVQYQVEGHESPEFWSALGAGPSPNYHREVEVEEPRPTPRLYHCYNTPDGRFNVEQVFSFSQKDLYSDDTMILDTGDEMVLWVGKDASEDEKRSTHKLIERFLSGMKEYGRRRPVVITVRQGQEPPMFTEHFEDWDDSYWESATSYEDLRNEIEDFNRSLKLY